MDARNGGLKEPTNPQLIVFDGRFINLSAIARAVSITPSHASRIFAGKRTPSLRVLQGISKIVGLSLDEFMSALDKHLAA